jgi:hypothetical protein
LGFPDTSASKTPTHNEASLCQVDVFGRVCVIRWTGAAVGFSVVVRVRE